MLCHCLSAYKSSFLLHYSKSFLTDPGKSRCHFFHGPRCQSSLPTLDDEVSETPLAGKETQTYRNTGVRQWGLKWLKYRNCLHFGNPHTQGSAWHRAGVQWISGKIRTEDTCSSHEAQVILTWRRQMELLIMTLSGAGWSWTNPSEKSIKNTDLLKSHSWVTAVSMSQGNHFKVKETTYLIRIFQVSIFQALNELCRLSFAG